MLLFIAEVRGHIDEDYVNYCIDFAPILRNIDIKTNKETIGEFMYNHLVEHKLPHDTVERKLTNLVDTNNEVMSFNNYYLWLLIDQFHFIIDEIVSVTTFSKHDSFNSFVKEFMSIRQQAKDDKNDGIAQFAKIVLNSSFGGDALNSEKYSNTKLLSSERTFLQHMMNGFIHSTELNDDLYAVQVDKESCRAFDKTKTHIVQLDTDSLTLAIAGDSRDNTQGFDDIIIDPEFYNKNKGFFFSENGQIIIKVIQNQMYFHAVCIAILVKLIVMKTR
ncbi:MAG: hypothetical protein EZS28_049510 [Streblomastix strix]|uniref:DNA-directed DNA polymerase n=1 Tax=Streblomastix strix TaxID=222440 RepID=A0A5J4TAU4_9EUKA|nr:MAG: hypothetical protein EZS28_049510 [Streblomastix strix]